MKSKYVLIAGLLVTLLLCPATVAALNYADVTVTAQPIKAPGAETLPATDINSVSGVLNGNCDAGGFSNATMGFQWGFATGNYTEGWNTTGVSGTFQHTVDGLALGTHVFYRAFVVNDLGTDYGDEMDFWTLLVPLAPTNFTATKTGYSSANLTWTLGAGATSTVIVVKDNGYPTNITDGYVVYNGTGNVVAVDGLNLDTTTYYYSAWSWNSYGYSVDYATTLLEGGNPQMVIGIIIIVLVLTVVAFVLKHPILHIVCVPSWLLLGVFLWNSSWPSGNTYLPTAMLMLTIIMAIVNLVVTVNYYLGQRTVPKTHNEVQSDYKRKIMELTAPKDKDTFWP